MVFSVIRIRMLDDAGDMGGRNWRHSFGNNHADVEIIEPAAGDYGSHDPHVGFLHCYRTACRVSIRGVWLQRNSFNAPVSKVGTVHRSICGGSDFGDVTETSIWIEGGSVALVRQEQCTVLGKYGRLLNIHRLNEGGWDLTFAAPRFKS